MQVSLLKVVPFSPSFTVFACPNCVLPGDIRLLGRADLADRRGLVSTRSLQASFSP
jgi:hypothetical protein